jgi:ribosome maturation factor RimP
MPAASDPRRHLLEVLAPVVSGLKLDLEDVSVSTVGRRSVVRVIIDGDDGVDLDAVAAVSRAVSDTLDADAVSGFSGLGGPYVLEVSSPGVDRLLTEQRHWRRATGRLVEVPVDGKNVTGRVTRTDISGVVLEVGRAHRTVDWSALGAGKVQVEFSRRGGIGNAAEDQTGDDADDEVEGDE